MAGQLRQAAERQGRLLEAAGGGSLSRGHMREYWAALEDVTAGAWLALNNLKGELESYRERWGAEVGLDDPPGA